MQCLTQRGEIRLPVAEREGVAAEGAALRQILNVAVFGLRVRQVAGLQILSQLLQVRLSRLQVTGVVRGLVKIY